MTGGLADAVRMARRPHDGLEPLYRRHGPVCTLGAGAFRYTYLLGPDANRFVCGHSGLFRWREAFETLITVDGETALIVSDGPDHTRRRRLVTPAFSSARTDGYAQVMRRNADAAIDRWRAGAVVDLYAEFRSVIRRSTVEVLFGPRLAAAADEIGRLLQPALDMVDGSPVWQRVQRLGLPAWRRAVAGRAAVAARIQDEIDRRRQDAADHGDVLTALLSSRDEDGNRLTDTEILDQVISLIAAGYETTSAAMAWAGVELLRHPRCWERAAAGADGSSWSYLDGVVSETLRLHPPAVLSARMAAEEFEFAGRTIPAGTLLLFSPYLTHRLPEIWPDPLRFDPSRWDPASPGYRRPGPHEFLPFGGGPHRCIGARFATVELGVLIERLVRRTELRLQRLDARPVGIAAMRPRRGPVVRVVAVHDAVRQRPPARQSG